MKNILNYYLNIIILTFVLHGVSPVYSQLEYKCEMEESYLPDIWRLNSTDLIPNQLWTPLTVNINLVFLYDQNGNGNYDMSDPEQANFVNGLGQAMNNVASNLTNGHSCNTGPYNFMSDSKIRFNVTTYFENTQTVWNHDNSNATYCCPDYWNTGWTEMYTYAQYFSQNHPDAINIYFTNGSSRLNHLQSNPPNPNDVPSKYDNDGCGDRPASFYSDSENFRISINDSYAEYYQRKHFPESYAPGNFTSEQVVGWHFSEAPILLVHELGHNLGLSHCEPSQYAPCINDIMNGDFNFCNWGWQGGRSYLSPKQLGRMHEILVKYNVNRTVDCDQTIGVPLELDESGVIQWDEPNRLYSDLIIKAGTHLQIFDDVIMPENTTITVEKAAKLEINGGYITSCQGQWEGIIVKGTFNQNQSNPANYGIVQTLNGAVIENARVGIGYAEDGPYTDWGGLIECDNTTFENCWKGAQFLAYDYENGSYFNNCDFSNCNEGVTIWRCKGIDFTLNTFDVVKNGITSVDAVYLVDNQNQFIGGKYGILSQSTAGNIASLHVTGENTFDNLGRGISVSGNVGYEFVDIEDNYFTNNSRGVVVAGDEFYNVRLNDFDFNDYNVLSAFSGTDYNEIGCNEMDNQYGGILTIWSNNNTTFLSNGFSYTDQNGYDYAGFYSNIRDEIGSGTVPARNIFSGVTNDIMSNTNCDHFYYYKKDTYSHPVNLGNYTTVNVINSVGSDCSNNTPTNVTKQEVIIKIDNYCIKLALYRSDPNNQIYREAFNEAQRLLHLYFYSWASDMEVIGSYSEIEALLKTLCNDHWKKKLFNLYFKFGDYTSASGVLDDMNDPNLRIIPIVSADLSDASRESFVETQRLNILYHQSNYSYQFTSSELDILRANAEGTIPESAYAKGLLYLITGEIVDIEIPEEYEKPIIPRSLKELDEEWSYYPNPANNVLNITFNGRDEFNGEIMISTIAGQNVLSEKLSISNGFYHEISISTLSEGTYILNVFNEEEMNILTKKFVKNIGE